MDDYHGRRSGQIPAFGDWDYANQLPITQYFECARQAGLVTRYSSSSGESDPTSIHPDFYAHPRSHNFAPQRKTKRGRERGRERSSAPAPAHVKEVHKKQGKKVCDVTEPQRKYPHQQNGVVPPKRGPTRPRARPKPVDEDLYKIPPELLHSNRKKGPKFFACLVPACAS